MKAYNKKLQFVYCLLILPTTLTTSRSFQSQMKVGFPACYTQIIVVCFYWLELRTRWVTSRTDWNANDQYLHIITLLGVVKTTKRTCSSQEGRRACRKSHSRWTNSLRKTWVQPTNYQRHLLSDQKIFTYPCFWCSFIDLFSKFKKLYLLTQWCNIN